MSGWLLAGSLRATPHGLCRSPGTRWSGRSGTPNPTTWPGRNVAALVKAPQGRSGRPSKSFTLEPTPISVYLTLLTSMFMHGGIAHLLGNMLFLWIFGDNIEDDLGHVRYLIFYLVCGVLASLAHVGLTVALSGLDSYQSHIPSLGASGAISGVLGAYLLLHPTNAVTVFLFRILTEVPAWVAIGMWFVSELRYSSRCQPLASRRWRK